MDQGLLGFATLLIGLAIGRQPVELLVSRPVASVRVLLDGKEVASLVRPPWRAVLDLGVGPIPHRVDAVGLDSAGAEIARAVQWVNLPRPEAELDLVLEKDDAGRIAGARLAWESSRPAGAPAVRAVLDGQPLVTVGADRVVFPTLDVAKPHFLRVEAAFGDGTLATREIVFGGVYADTGASALTAISVVVAGGRKPITSDEVTAAIPGGERLQVVAVESGSARVAVVIDRRALNPLQEAAHAGEVRGLLGPRQSRAWADTTCTWLREPPRSGQDDILQIDSRPRHFLRDSQDSLLFTAQQAARTRARDLVGVLLQGAAAPGDATGQAITNAVANAGLLAAAGGRRRAVVLIMGASEGGGGDLSVDAVREFLRLLGVPLRVWSPVAEVAMHGAAGWGAAEDVSTCAKLDRTSRMLSEELDRQRIVWVEGLHLPQDVVLSSARLARLE